MHVGGRGGRDNTIKRDNPERSGDPRHASTCPLSPSPDPDASRTTHSAHSPSISLPINHTVKHYTQGPPTCRQTKPGAGVAASSVSTSKPIAQGSAQASQTDRMGGWSTYTNHSAPPPPPARKVNASRNKRESTLSEQRLLSTPPSFESTGSIKEPPWQTNGQRCTPVCGRLSASKPETPIESNKRHLRRDKKQLGQGKQRIKGVPRKQQKGGIFCRDPLHPPEVSSAS